MDAPTNMNAADILAAAADTYRGRNKIYGDNYKHFGHAMEAIFPDGLAVLTADEWNRLGLFVQCVSKISRYAQNIANGGHTDSSHDLSVYAAMLQELTVEGTEPALKFKDAYNDGVRDALAELRSLGGEGNAKVIALKLGIK